MAWRSSGSNNEEMVDKLKRFGVITSDSLEEGFRCVDRKFFVPQGNEALAHLDQPLKEGNVHISAPHIYGSALQELDLIPNSSTSFLNIGSGTGYVSSIAAQILGPNALNYGVELHDDVIDHCKAALGKWKSSTIEEAKDDVSIVHFMDDTIADIQIIKGNGLNIMKTRGEGVVGFDRIYIGAAVDRDDLESITKLLTPGGVLVGPVDDDLVKVTRVGAVSKDLEDDTEDEDSSLAGLNEEFTSQILSGVRFAPLTTSSAVTVIPANVWNPTIQRGYPAEFKQASMQLLMCASSQLVQPLPRVPTEIERTNVASMLPKPLWLEVLSYTHRNWFKPEQNETDYLKRRLREEKLKNANLERARREAEEKCAAAERERSVYKMLARRWQSRLDTLLNEHEEQGNHNNAEQDLLDLADGIRDDETAVVNNRNRSALSNLRDILQNINSDDEEDNMEEPGDDDDDMNMDLEEENEFDEDEFVSAVEEEEEEDINEEDVDHDSVVMEDVNVDTSMEEVPKPRTVSVSSDDL